jgi:hypothetical protein
MATSKPTSAVVNVVYAVHYPLKRSGLSSGAKIGVGVGAGLGGLLLIALGIVGCFLLFRRRQPRGDAPAVPTTGQPQEYSDAKQPQVQTYQQAVYPSTVAAGPPAAQIMPPGGVYPATFPPPAQPAGQPTVYQQASQVSPISTPSPAYNVSPVQAPQELHNPHWAGRHELQGQ